MIKNLHRIASADQAQRRGALQDILREYGIPFVLYHEPIGSHWVDNIAVPIGAGPRRLVVGAHYDSLEGSAGANDNAAAVCVLIELAKRLTGNPPAIPTDIVFFDREEYDDRGSEAYIERFGRAALEAMINLDVCGVGDAIVVGPQRNLADRLLGSLFGSAVLMKKHGAAPVAHIPPGDERSFERAGIPNVSIAILPSGDVDLVVKMAEAIEKKKKPTKRDVGSLPFIMETMHNRSMDTLGIVDENAMRRVLGFLSDVFHVSG